VSSALDNTSDDPRRRAALALDPDYAAVTERVCSIVERRAPPRWWYPAFGVSVALSVVLFAMVGYLVARGIGVWGVNSPVGWGFAIINFVFWVGIGHAGTLISAILFLFRQKWRTGINRFAEAMTIFAVICAGLFPAIHIGRVWLAYWLFPYPNQMRVWPNFRSPLLWDVFAVSTYFSVSLMFWYVGLIPDLATLRDRARTRLRAAVYGLLALGWRGSGRHWLVYERVYLLLAALATPLVLSVHSVVSFDFAVSVLPGWHATIFPPYFVAGAIFCGFAMVVLLAVPARHFFGLRELITLRHLENMNKIILATGLMVGYAYFVEFFIAWYSGNTYEHFVFVNRAGGPYAWAYWIMVICNVVSPQLFWSKRIRTTPWMMVVVAVFVNIGMWFERFVIVVTSLHRDFLPSSWGYYRPTWADLLTLLGSFGLFFTLFLLFLRFLPMVAMAEVKSVMPEPQALRVPAPAPQAAAAAPAGPRGTGRLLAEFETPGQLLAAARELRDEGYRRFDCHSPFPVHGLESAMGLRDTRLPWVVLGAGGLGAGTAILMQWWMNAVDYPLNYSGKPLFSLPAQIPIAFELTVLFAATAAFLGLFVFNRLPRLGHPLLGSRRFARATADRFFVAVEADDPRFDPGATEALLRGLGSRHVEWVEGAA